MQTNTLLPIQQQTKEDIMKNVALITLLISGIAFSAIAQDRGARSTKSAEEIAQMRTDRLTEQLTLTKDQQQAVYALSLENASKMQAEHKERAKRADEMRKARTAMMDERRAEMKASQERLNEILTNEQREVLKQQQAERAEKMKSMRDADKNGKFKGDRPRRGKRDFHKKVDSTPATETSPEATQ